MIGMVAEHVIIEAQNYPVHPDGLALSRLGHATYPGRIESSAARQSMPFVLIQALEVLRIHDGELSLGQRYSSKRVAVPQPTIQECQEHAWLFQPVRDVQDNLYGHNLRCQSCVLRLPPSPIIGRTGSFDARKVLGSRFVMRVTGCCKGS